MKIISWNVIGLGRPRKNLSIKEILRKYKANIIMLQETKNQQSVGNASMQFVEAGTMLAFFSLIWLSGGNIDLLQFRLFQARSGVIPILLTFG